MTSHRHDSKVAGFDGYIGKIQQCCLRHHNRRTSSISLNAVDVDFDSLCVDFGDERPESKLLQKARNLIGANQYEPALAALNDVFAIAPQHSEGTYLKAFCEHHLGNSKKSLTTLRELTGVALSNRLQTNCACSETKSAMKCCHESAEYLYSCDIYTADRSVS